MKTLSLFLIWGFFPMMSASKLRSTISEMNDQQRTTLEISRCTKFAADKLFKSSNDVSIVTLKGSYYNETLTTILRSQFIDQTIKIQEDFERTNNLTRETSYIVIVNRENLDETMKGKRVKRWSEYLILTDGSNDWLRGFSSRLWGRGFRKVAIISTQANNEMKLYRMTQKSSIKGSMLKSHNICSKSSPIEIHSFSSWSNTEKKSSVTYTKIFEGLKDIQKFSSKKTNRTSDATHSGGKLVKIFAEKNNFQHFLWDWEDMKIEPNWRVAVSRSIENQLDFFYATQLQPEEVINNEKIVPISWYIFDSLVFVDANKKIVLPMSSLLTPFASNVWLWSLPVTLLFFLFAQFTDYLWKRRINREGITLLSIFAICVGQTVPKMPTKCGFRFVIGMWLIRNLIINGAYTGALSSSLINDAERYRLRTFQDILDSGRPICGSEKTLELFKDPDDPIMRGIRDRYKVTPNDQIFDAIFNENCISARPMSYVTRYNRLYEGNYLRQLYVIEDAVIVTYPVFFFTKKYHPYAEEFNRIISLLRDDGIVDKIASDYQREYESKKNKNGPSQKDVRVLNMKHLQGTFKLLLLGHLLAGVVFIIETIVGMRSSKKNRKMKILRKIIFPSRKFV